jgi:hypothetical protein
MAKIPRDVFDKIIEMSAQGKPPKEIYEELDIDRAIVYAVRSQYRDKIDARQPELAAQQESGEPDATFDAIMDIIDPEKVELAPESKPMPNPLPIAPAPEPEPLKALRTTQLRFAGAQHRYTVTGNRIGIDGGRLMLDIAEMDDFITELREVRRISGR